MLREVESMSWLEFACAYADMKWDGSSPSHRSSIADSLVAITMAVLPDGTAKPETSVLSRSLRRTLNRHQRDAEQSTEIADAIDWARRNSPLVGDLAEPSTLRSLLSALDKKRDGKRAAYDTSRLRRTHLRNALDYAVEQKLLDSNPLGEVKVRKQTTVLRQVDRRTVPNPSQARQLLRAVKAVAPRLLAFFGLLYFAGLRPEEAANLRKNNLAIPESGWGEIHIDRATPEVAEQWTDSRTANEERGLKHREDNTGRTVPCSDELTELLHGHLDAYGTAADGRLFRGSRDGGRISSRVYGRVWAKARAMALEPEEAQLAPRPYDLRHAALSTWLNATGDPVRVAEWAGNSVRVLLHVYAKCLDGGEEAARRKVAERLRAD